MSPATDAAGAHEPGGPGPGAGPVTRRRPAVLVGVLLGALVVVASVVWALAQRGDDPAPGAAPTASASSSPEPSSPAEETPPAPVPTPGAEPAPAPADPTALPEQPALPEPLVPRALTEEVEIGPEAVARVTRLEAVESQPQGAGEIAGPALRFTIEVQNTGTAPIPVQDAVINVTHGADAAPATEVSGPGRQPFAGEIAPGQSATGTYVFVVPVEGRELVSVSLEYRAGAPVAVFQGSAAAAPVG